MQAYDLIIIGGGVAGFGTAMYAGRLALKTLVITEMRGGLITTTNDVSNYPGFKKLTGPELAEKIEEHAKDYDIDIVDKKVVKIEKKDVEKNAYFHVYTKDEHFAGRTICFATGTRIRKLNCPGEKEFEGRGVNYCALCDGAFYRGKTVSVIGGSDSAAKDALVLAQYAEKVHMICRGEKIRPEPVNGEKVEKNEKISIIPNTNVVEIKGGKKVSSVVLDKPHNGEKELVMDGVFVAIGHIPLSELAAGIGVEVNSHGEIKIDRCARTNIPGVYAAGDVTDTSFKQAITGVAEGVHAAYQAYLFVNENAFVIPTGE